MSDLSNMSDVTSQSTLICIRNTAIWVFPIELWSCLTCGKNQKCWLTGVLIEAITPRVTYATKSRDWKLASLGFCYCCCFVAGDRWTGMSMLRSPIVTMTDALPTKDWELFGGWGGLMLFCLVACDSVLTQILCFLWSALVISEFLHPWLMNTFPRCSWREVP